MSSGLVYLSPHLSPYLSEQPTVESAHSGEAGGNGRASSESGAFAADLAPWLNGFAAVLAPAARPFLPGELKVAISREGGRLRIELPELPSTLWTQLAALAQSMAAGTAPLDAPR